MRFRKPPTVYSRKMQIAAMSSVSQTVGFKNFSCCAATATMLLRTHPYDVCAEPFALGCVITAVATNDVAVAIGQSRRVDAVEAWTIAVSVAGGLLSSISSDRRAQQQWRPIPRASWRFQLSTSEGCLPLLCDRPWLHPDVARSLLPQHEIRLVRIQCCTFV